MILSIKDLKKQLLSFLNSKDFSSYRENVLVNFVYKIEDADLASFIDPIIKGNKKVFYYNKHEECITILAFNETFPLRITGENKFSGMGEKISLYSRNMIRNLDKESSDKFPLFVGGTKFCTGRNSDEWEDFADNDWFVPQFLFYRKDNDCYLILNFHINNQNHSENLIDCFLEPLDKVINQGIIVENDKAKIKIFTDDKARDEWDKLISNALSKIYDGSFRKVVFSRRVIADVKNTPLFGRILQRLQDNYKNCTVFLYSSEDSILFGATPEQFLKFRKDELEFDALAGSAKRGNSAEDDDKIACDLLIDKKNSEEHNHVIEFIKDASSKYVSDIQQSETGIKKFSNIQHIYTPIRAKLKSGKQIYNLVDEIFPTPAICGYPKIPSLNYIIENENFDRGLFSGIIGFISPIAMDLVVALRCALLKGNRLYIYAGCGIVNGSDPRSEFEETEIKMKPILSLFNEY